MNRSSYIVAKSDQVTFQERKKRITIGLFVKSFDIANRHTYTEKYKTALLMNRK